MPTRDKPLGEHDGTGKKYQSSREQSEYKAAQKTCENRHNYALKDVMRERDHDYRCHHEAPGSHDRARRQPRNTANAVTGRATAAEPRAESDQKPTSDDSHVAPRHLRRRHRIADERRSNRRGDKAG